MVHGAHEAHPASEWDQRLSRLAEFEIGTRIPRMRRSFSRKPAPFGNAVLFARERHAVRGVDGAEAARNLVSNLSAHRIQHREDERDAPESSQEGAPVKSKRRH